MDLKELSESVQQQAAPVPLISPKRQIRSRFQLNLDKTIESCKAQLGMSLVCFQQQQQQHHLWGYHQERSKLDPGCFEPQVVCSTNTSFHSWQNILDLLTVRAGSLNSSGCVCRLWQPADARGRCSRSGLVFRVCLCAPSQCPGIRIRYGPPVFHTKLLPQAGPSHPADPSCSVPVASLPLPPCCLPSCCLPESFP